MNAQTIRRQFADTMLEVGQKDSDLVVVIGDISHFALQPFACACPGRFFNIGICEPASVSLAAGLARMNFHVVLHTISPFLVERCFEQIKLDFCYQQLPGNLVTVGSAFDFSNLGVTHHCYGDFALLKTLPNVEIVYPGSAREFDVLFRQTYNNQALTFFRVAAAGHGRDLGLADIALGRGFLARPGRDVTLVATGPHLDTALAAADMLTGKSLEAEVIYVHTIRPLDTSLLADSLARTGKVVVIEEHMRSGGLGDDIIRYFHNDIDFKIASVSIPDDFVHSYGTYIQQLQALDMTPAGLANQVLSLCRGKA